MMELTASLAAHIGEAPYFGPNRDILMRELFNFCSERFEGLRHFIFCDSAFFLNMPEYARSYAIPFEYTEGGLIRYPRNGIVHEWAVNSLVSIKGPKTGKTITIFLNDGADVVALKDGRPVMTSQGFSDFDGVVSQTGCGLIDTSIVFQLFSAGYSLKSIYQVLSQESGFKALIGEELRLSDLIVRDDTKAIKALDIFSYQLIKAIGACVALLEGVDSVVFIGDNEKEIHGWTCHFLRNMKFLKDPPIKSYYFGFDKWQLMAQLLLFLVFIFK
jgi:acetate kinase